MKRIVEDLHFHYDVDKKTYILDDPIKWYCERYKKFVVVESGFPSDGASGPATDIVSWAWWIHDKICKTNKWADGSSITGWQRSVVIHDVLLEEGRWFRARSWFVATLFWEFCKVCA